MRNGTYCISIGLWVAAHEFVCKRTPERFAVWTRSIAAAQDNSEPAVHGRDTRPMVCGCVFGGMQRRSKLAGAGVFVATS